MSKQQQLLMRRNSAHGISSHVDYASQSKKKEWGGGGEQSFETFKGGEGEKSTGCLFSDTALGGKQ